MLPTRMEVTLYSITSLFAIAVGAQLRQIRITEYALMRDKNMASGDISQSVKKTAIACAILCVGSDTCKSYFYRHATGECQLHSKLFTSPDKVKSQIQIKSKGFKYYYIVEGAKKGRGDGCPLKKGFRLLSDDGPCVKFHNDTKSWYAANRTCVSYSLHSRLVVLDNEQKSNLVRAAGMAMNASFHTDVWIGLYKPKNNPHSWVNGKLLKFNAFSRRVLDVPNKNCVAHCRGDGWYWVQTPCNYAYHYICETML